MTEVEVDINDKPHLDQSVLILGSGFSKAIHSTMPTLTDLSQCVLKSLQRQEYKNFLSQIPNNIQNNVEYLLTYLMTDLPWKTTEDKHIHMALYSRVAKTIEQQVRFKSHEAINSNPLSITAEQLTNLMRWVKYNTIPVITFNYDCLFEHYFSDLLTKNLKDHQFNNDKSGQPMNKFEYRDLYPVPLKHLELLNPTSYYDASASFSKGSKYDLLKLHGSINWFYSGLSNDPTETIYYAENMNDAYQTQKTKDLIPFIVPPIVDKSHQYQHSVVKSLWKQAAMQLQRAKDLYIIGYSLPETDLATNFLLQANLQPEAKIHIINKLEEAKIDEFRTRINKLLDRECDFTYLNSGDPFGDFIDGFVVNKLPSSEQASDETVEPSLTI